MNEQKIIEHMIHFIEEKERDWQAGQMTTAAKSKSDIVNLIIAELEREMTNENH